jgi:hypothetical protein
MDQNQKWTREHEAEERAAEPLESVAASEPLAPQVGSTSGDMPHMIRALRNRDFRWFWGAIFSPTSVRGCRTLPWAGWFCNLRRIIIPLSGWV